MKKLLALVLVLVCVFSLAGCEDKNAAKAEAAALAAITAHYDTVCTEMVEVEKFKYSAHDAPEITTVEKVDKNQYLVTGTITGSNAMHVVEKNWIAEWSLTMVKDENGAFVVASDPLPDYGGFIYTN